MVDSFFSLDQGSEAISHTSQPDFESADQGLKAIHLYCGFGILIQVQNGFAF
jgi:hypothetical protein